GNVAELRRLLAKLRFKAPAVFMSGEPYANLKRAGNARCHLVLPHAKSQLKVIQNLGVEHAETGLPMSIGGTKSWLRRVGKHLGVEQLANDAIAQETKRLKPLAELAHRQLAGKRFALFADAP